MEAWKIAEVEIYPAIQPSSSPLLGCDENLILF